MDQQESIFLQTVRVEVDIVDLFDFAEGSKRNWKEGNEIFNNNHVLVAGVTKVAGSSVHIFCSCLRGSNPAEPPREIRMITSNQLKSWEIRCSCPAGNYRCKHQFACLLYIHRNKDLEVLSCTDVRQQWGKVAKIQAESLYEPVALSALCNQRKKEPIEMISNELCTTILNLFVTELPDSALAKSLAGRSVQRPTKDECSRDESSVNQPCASYEGESKPELPEWNPAQRSKVLTEDDPDEIELAQSYLKPFFSIPHLTSKWKYYHGPLSCSILYLFYESRVCVSPEESLMICAQSHNQSNEIWRRERRIRITASECYDLYTYYLNDPGDRDWSKKLSSIIHPLEKRLSPLMFGKEMEGIALQCYRKKNQGKKIIKMGLVIPPSAPFLGCSPDAVVVDDPKLVEIKCPFSGKDKPLVETLEKLKWIDRKNNNFELRKKHAYYGQVQLGMCLTRTRSADLVIYNAYENDCFVINVDYDSDFISKLIPVLREIYFNIFLPMLCTE